MQHDAYPYQEHAKGGTYDVNKFVWNYDTYQCQERTKEGTYYVNEHVWNYEFNDVSGEINFVFFGPWGTKK